MPPRRGQIEHTARSTAQDASDAMRGDIVRGLVEIVTNSDDEYIREETDGLITITVEHLSDSDELAARVIVSDAATGLTADEMVQKLTKLGTRSSDFEQGRPVRGLHGRGFKDVASFGSVEFESIKDGSWAKITLKENDLDYWLYEEPTEPDREIRKRLGLGDGESGSTVTISVRRPLPVLGNVFDRLCRVAELRHISNERTVTFSETGVRVEPSRPLYYEAPPSKEVLRKDVVVPGYPEASAELVVYEMEEPQAGPVNPESHHGLLVRGRRGVYMNTLLGLDSKPGSGYFRGDFSCPYIDDLIREYDDKQQGNEEQSKENPIRLVSRRRDGLHEEHPFTKKLKKLFSEELLPLIQELEKRETRNRGPGNEIQNRLDALARELARMLSDDLAELEQDEGDGGDGIDEAPLKIIPGRVRLQPKEEKTLTIHIRPDQMIGDWDGDVSASSDVPDIVSLKGEPDAPEPHPQDPKLLVSRIRVTSGLSDGNAVVRVKAGENTDACTVTVDSKGHPPPSPPEGLEFVLSHIRMRMGRKRTVEIRAPLDLVVGAEPDIQVKIDGDPTIKLLTDTCRLRLDRALGWYSGRIGLIGEMAEASGEIIAHLRDNRATVPVEVVDPTDSHGLDLEIVWEDYPLRPFRGSLEPSASGHVLKIYGGHPAISHLLGSYDRDRKEFENSGKPEVRIVIAEILATEMTHYLVEREFNRPGERFDAPSYAAKYRDRLGRYLATTQRMLLAGDS